MILNTGNRTDIPAFYSEWFMNRVREGYALSRSPYAPQVLYRYRFDPETVDMLVFCTKNPAPMLNHLNGLSAFPQFWSVTITPYGKDIEPNVPDKYEVMDAFRTLSGIVGKHAVCWRYDPVFISDVYTAEDHILLFEEMAAYLSGYTDRAVISFIDLYEKTRRNFPEAEEVSRADRLKIGKAFAEIADSYGMKLHTCLEGEELACFGIDTSGCMTREVLEEVLGEELAVPASAEDARKGCRCLLGGDIGAYNTCRHFCRYCYANYDRKTVMENSLLHDPASPLLIGHVLPTDEIRDVKQIRYSTGQQSFRLI